MIEYFVIAVEVCAECNGKGFVPNPQWAELDAARATITGAEEREQKFREFWVARCENPDSPPPDEFWCIECEGQGKSERRVPLAEALAQISMPQ